MNAKALGTILKDWRIECNKTQAKLGKDAGLSRKVVGSIERGERKIDGEEIVQVCRALGRNAEDLVLHWSRSTLQELQKIERALLGSRDTGQSDKPDSATSEAATGGSINEHVNKLAALIKEIIHAAQAELIQKLQLEMNLSGASSPPPAAPKRPRSRVSRRGRTGGRDPA
ncbi:MAG TPA: helix-turn-helix transcriptional regulator [Thermoanaerobaculia bacterium]|nr:helix-turn-helix transcriptional regulator [Thermoanaerobaculia bacterium]